MKKRLLLWTCLFALLFGLRAETVSAENRLPVTYRVTFDANWSNATHPHSNFPSSDHWSALVGTTHNDAFTLWQNGELATLGMKNVAEFGSNGALRNEVNAAIAADNAYEWIQQGFSPNIGPGLATVDIEADYDYPLLSLATMIAPSPDWFAGVSNLSLLDGNGNWQQSITMALYPYDAGTDSGTDYQSGNAATMPFQPIAVLTGVSPFSSAPVGTLTVTLLSAPSAVGFANAQAATSTSILWPIAVITLALATLSISKKAGGYSKPPAIIDTNA